MEPPTDPAGPVHDRALGALLGLAVGDALGMPTQSLPRSEIIARFGALVADFAPADDDHPIAAGLPAATVTDDTEQALLLAVLLAETGGAVPARVWAERLLRWEDDMRGRGSHDLLGPSTRRALDALAAGAGPAEAGRHGTTNGAAMRITPVGIAAAADDLADLVERVVEASVTTHNTAPALAAAAAVAAAVSTALDGAGLAELTAAALEAAALAGRRGHPAASGVGGPEVAARIAWAVELVDGLPVDAAVTAIATRVGTSLHSHESVPAAFAAVHAAGGDAWLACRIGASVGGDTDTIAAIAGAVGGALGGAGALPERARQQVVRVNRAHLSPLDDLVTDLLAVRYG